MSRPIVLVTGAHGQVGNEMRVLSAQYPGFEFQFVDKDELLIDDVAAVNDWFATHKPAYCLNCAAYTAVDKAETDRDTAMRVNADAVGILAAACKQHNTRFIHISTDYVFSGEASTPYKETDATQPVNFYGDTKLKGEELCLAADPSAIIIRTSWVYSEFGGNFVKTMMRLMKEKPSLNVVEDQFGSPTWARDLAAAMLHIIHAQQTGSRPWQPGIYHYSNEGIISWCDFARAIAELTGSACEVKGIPTSGYPTPAKRPAWSAFNKDKIKAAYNLSIPNWRESLATVIKVLTAPAH
ncbi:MAG: dTDP-4-dehydrorhamnose reductase [Bacteroidetes bacterium]|nr:dTDP-4-dehydrorhamnose reductase [Bacteroidota bacterium]